MPKRDEIKSVLIIGSGPIVIGQACEFDYSGTQACKVLKQEGLRVILVNSNPATIMTDPQFADATYVEPINPEIVEKIIAKERPDEIALQNELLYFDVLSMANQAAAFPRISRSSLRRAFSALNSWISRSFSSSEAG